jgi:putative membrane protein
MSTITTVLAALVAIEHLWFLVLEMFLWQKPIGLRTFKMTPEIAATSATLAANQGLYNGFLAAGIITGLAVSDPGIGFALIAFSLSCVIAAGIFGAATVSGRILVLQAVPAAAALAALVFLR